MDVCDTECVHIEWVPQQGDGWGHRLVGEGQGSGGWEGA